MIVNGAAQALGSDHAQIERAIVADPHACGDTFRSDQCVVGDGKLTINAPAGKTASEKSEVWLCPMSKAVPVTITRGENKGKSITYHNVVRRWIKIGEWNGAAASWTVPVAGLRVSTVDQVAVIFQQGYGRSAGADARRGDSAASVVPRRFSNPHNEIRLIDVAPIARQEKRADICRP